jgi:hypothetical protein
MDQKRFIGWYVCGLVVMVVFLVCHRVGAQVLVSKPLGTLAVLDEVVKLRAENAQLKAQLIGRDRQIANLTYERDKKLVECHADLSGARLSLRASDLLPTLQDLLRPEDGAVFDWSLGRYVKPSSQAGDKR